MNFYPFHIGDYISHTSHLSDAEDLAYRRLIDLYYQTEAPFPHELTMLARKVKSINRRFLFKLFPLTSASSDS